MSAKQAALSSSRDIARAHLVYTRDNGKRQVTYIPSRNEESDNEAYIVVEQYIRDARETRPRPTLAEHGFQLITHDTALSNKDFYTNVNGKVEKVYYQEMMEAVKKVCPYAVEVMPFHHMIRKAPDSASKKSCGKPSEHHAHGSIGKPAGAVHCDYTVRNAISLFDSMAKAEYRKGRYAVINVWRNISESSPIQNDHLALCDARTVIAPDDFVPCDVIYPDHISETYRLDPGQKSFHEWYYYPNMIKKEVLIFMQYDSDFRTRTRYTFHSSFRSPHAKLDAPPRESIECRCIAFFPHHKPNTIPEIMYKGDEVVSAAIIKIMQSLLYPDKWPKDAQKWMRTELYRTGGIQNVIEELVHGGAKRQQYSLHNATQEQRDEIIRNLLSDGTFEKTAKSNFLRL